MSISPQYRLAGLVIVALLVIGLVVIYRQSSQSTPALSPLNQAFDSPLANDANDSPLASLAPTATGVELPILQATSTSIVVTAPPPVVSPTATMPPIPTAVPTPAVTPIPTAAPPYIDGLTAQSVQHFWFYRSQGDEVWRIDLLGNNKELIVDTFAITGDHLLGIPPNGEGSDCCEPTPYFTMSPNGQKVALIVIDQATINAESAFRKFPYGSATAIHIYDTQQDRFLSLGEGTRPIWSPDSRQVAFWRKGSLWVADTESGEMRVRLQAAVEMDMRVTEYAWSPDSSQIAVMYQLGGWKSGAPTLWILNANDDSEPRMVVQKPYSELAAIRWAGDGRYIYYFSTEGQKDNYQENQVQNLWRLDVADGTTQQLTKDMLLYGYSDFLPGTPWIVLSGYQLYEPFEGEYRISDLWLLNPDALSLLRLTAGEEDYFAWYVMPDAVHLLLGEVYPFRLRLFSLVDGTIVQLDQLDPEMVEYFNSIQMLSIR